MPSHVPSDEADLASSDEVKVFDDEGEFSEERRSSSIGDGDVTEEMNELKQKLIDEEERPPTQQSQGPTAASSTTSRQATSQSQSQSTQQSNQPSVSSASGTRQSPSTQMGLEASASNSSHPSSSSLCAFGAYYSPFHPSNGSLAPVRLQPHSTLTSATIHTCITITIAAAAAAFSLYHSIVTHCN